MAKRDQCAQAPKGKSSTGLRQGGGTAHPAAQSCVAIKPSMPTRSVPIKPPPTWTIVRCSAPNSPRSSRSSPSSHHASAVHVVVQVSRLVGGARKIVKVSEVTGVEADTYAMQDLFVFKQTGVDDERRAQGCFHATGLRPHFAERLESLGEGLPAELFRKRILTPGSRLPF